MTRKTWILVMLTVVVSLATAFACNTTAKRGSVDLDPTGFATTASDHTTSPAGHVDVDTSPLLAVTVIPSKPVRTRPVVRSYGEVTARFRTILRAETAGTLLSVTSQADSGRRVRRGTVLMKLDDSRLVEALARAEADVGDAHVRLSEENLRAQQAAADWDRIGNGEPASEFLLREPQRESARLTIAAAEAAVLEARNNLDRAVIRAPFDAVVVRRHASLGSYVQPGTELLELDSSNRVEVRLPLSSEDWELLPPESELLGWPVALASSSSSSHVWRGQVSRIEQHVVSESRQRSLVVTVADPLDLDPPLFPGTFVRAKMEGRELNDVLKLPVSAMTERNEIWFVDTEGRLARAPVEAMLTSDGLILVRLSPPIPTAEVLDVLVHPMASYLPGIAVDKKVVDDASS
ncbi:MAG: efflux RND transporter periplasmic adaptor subunit [Acidobacteriota bacterium]